MRYLSRSSVLVMTPFLALFLTACDVQKQAEFNTQDIYNQVAADAVKQYEIARNNGGTPIDICVQAGLVTAAYLQAKDENNYRDWKEKEKILCDRAGVPK